MSRRTSSPTSRRRSEFWMRIQRSTASQPGTIRATSTRQPTPPWCIEWKRCQASAGFWRGRYTRKSWNPAGRRLKRWVHDWNHRQQCDQIARLLVQHWKLAQQHKIFSNDQQLLNYKKLPKTLNFTKGVKLFPTWQHWSYLGRHYPASTFMKKKVNNVIQLLIKNNKFVFCW